MNLRDSNVRIMKCCRYLEMEVLFATTTDGRIRCVHFANIENWLYSAYAFTVSHTLINRNSAVHYLHYCKILINLNTCVAL